MRQVPMLLTLLLSLGLAACGGGGGDAPPPPENLPPQKSPQEALGDILVEVEVNDTPVDADSLSTQGLGGGVLTTGDVDFWEIPAIKGDPLRIQVYAIRLGLVAADWVSKNNCPRLTLYDPDGTTVLLDQWSSGDGTKQGFDPATRFDMDLPLFVPPATGTFFLRVSLDDASGSGSTYLLDVSPPTFFGVQHEAEAEGQTGLNDTPSTAEALSLPSGLHALSVDSPVHGFSDGPGGVDLYSLILPASTRIHLDLMGRRLGRYRLADDYASFTIRLLDSSGAQLAVSASSTFGDPALTYRTASGGAYYVEVSATGPAAPYLLDVFANDGMLISENEPNNGTASANLAGSGNSYAGQIDTAGDEDWYRIDTNGGEELWMLSFAGARNETSLVDVELALFDSVGATVALGQQPLLGSHRAVLAAPGPYYLRVTSREAGQTPPYWIYLSGASGDAEMEPNDGTPDVNSWGTSSMQVGSLSSGTDLDVYECPAMENELMVFELRGPPSPVDLIGWTDVGGPTSMAMALSNLSGLVTLLGPLPAAFASLGIAQPRSSLMLVHLSVSAETYQVQVASLASDVGGYTLTRLR